MSVYDRVYKILIIDDDKALQLMLKTVLASHGFDVISTYSGEEGLALAKKEKPDLIILDVIMPGIKGREVCSRLKAEADSKDIPVLFLTAKDSDDDVAAELGVGAVGHVTKPVNSMSLVRKIKQILGA
jgi:DNA-binding response OmpR family regulator